KPFACSATADSIDAIARVSIIKVTPSVWRMSIPVTRPKSAAMIVPKSSPNSGSGATWIENSGLAEGDDAAITQRESDREGEEDHLERGRAETDISVGDKEDPERDRPRKDMPGPAQAAIAAAKLRERRSWIVDRRPHGADRAGTKPCGRHSSKTMTNT